MERLLEGYRRFRETEWPERRALFETLARDGQAPQAMVIACSDSRVDPAMIFGAGPGDLFVLRNIANLVPPSQPEARDHAASAALEFAVRVLEVPHLIVMGHAMCGGVRALLHGAPHPAGDFLTPWMRIAEPARRRALACDPADPQTACEHEVVKLSLENLRTFPWIAERVDAGRLRLHGATFDIRSGVLFILQADGSFAPA
ncbi:MAG: carbonic anhydrase [Acetobacteraceae bacterium]|nr:carbonic anhydrase [Acetobacteraceae bacterium]